MRFSWLAYFRMSYLKSKELLLFSFMKLGKSANETFAMLSPAYGDTAKKKRATYFYAMYVLKVAKKISEGG